MKRNILIALLMLTVTVLLAACGSNAPQMGSEAGSAAPETPDITPEVFAVIGQEAEGDTVYSLKLTNRTGADITAVSVKADTEEAYPENMLPAEEVFVSGETRVLYYDAAAAMETAEQINAQAADDVQEIRPAYTVQLTFADGTVQELHAFPFGDAEACDIFLNGELAYLSYVSLTTEETVSTQAAEQAIRDAAAAEEAAQQAAAAEAARQQAAAEEAARQAAEEAARQAAEQAAQQQAEEEQDGCVDDGLMY